MADGLTADEQVVGTSLAYHYQGIPGLLSICSDADRWVGRRFPTDPAGIAAAVQYVMHLDRQRPKGIYDQVTTLREQPEKGRGGKDLAHAVTLLWADGDFGTAGHKPGLDDMPHPIDAQHVREIVSAAGLPEPSGWWLSGGGCNPVWQLDEPRIIGDAADRAAVEQITMGLQAILGACAYGHGCGWDTQVGNLDRLMRIPGTVNRKGGDERETSSLPGSGQAVTFDAMLDAVSRLEPDARRILEKAAQEKRARHDERTGHPSVPLPAPRPSQTFPAHGGGTGAFDVLASQLTFREVLEPAGWTYRGTAGDGREKWLRPAGAEGSADSDYSLICDDHVAVNWSERSGLPVGQQPPGRKLTVPTLWAQIHYGGNEREAALDVLRAAFGQGASRAAVSLPAQILALVQQRCNPPRPPEPDQPTPAAPLEDIDWPELNGSAMASKNSPVPAPTVDQPTGEDEREPTGWTFFNLASVLDGTYKPPQPTVGRRDDGVGMFYPGKMNSVAGESEGGKTWLALLACLTEINRGNHVVYMDFEDDAGGVVTRLLVLGGTPEDILARFHYVRPESSPQLADMELLIAAVASVQPTLAVVDGVTEAMSMFGLELKDNTDIATFSRRLLRPFIKLGAAVVTLDHVVKNGDNRGRYSLGGVHKLNGLSGVMYIVEPVNPFGIGLTGRSRVRIAKDRPAQIRRHALPAGDQLHWYGDLVVKSLDESFAEAHLYPPNHRPENDPKAAEEKAKFEATKQQIVAALKKAKKPLTGRDVEDRVSGRAMDVRRALADLVDTELVALEKGERNAKFYTLPT